MFMNNRYAVSTKYRKVVKSCSEPVLNVHNPYHEVGWLSILMLKQPSSYASADQWPLMVMSQGSHSTSSYCSDCAEDSLVGWL